MRVKHHGGGFFFFAKLQHHEGGGEQEERRRADHHAKTGCLLLLLLHCLVQQQFWCGPSGTGYTKCSITHVVVVVCKHRPCVVLECQDLGMRVARGAHIT